MTEESSLWNIFGGEQRERMQQRINRNPAEYEGYIQGIARLALWKKPKLIVELGTHVGNSAFAFCCYLQKIGEGSLVTIDIDHSSWTDLWDDIRKFNWASFVKFMTMDSIEAAKVFPSPIDLLYIDTDHSYQRTLDELRAWVSKISSRGTLAMDDFFLPTRLWGPSDVAKGFIDYCRENDNYLKFSEITIFTGPPMTNPTHGLLVATVK